MKSKIKKMFLRINSNIPSKECTQQLIKHVPDLQELELACDTLVLCHLNNIDLPTSLTSVTIPDFFFYTTNLDFTEFLNLLTKLRDTIQKFNMRFDHLPFGSLDPINFFSSFPKLTEFDMVGMGSIKRLTDCLPIIQAIPSLKSIKIDLKEDIDPNFENIIQYKQKLGALEKLDLNASTFLPHTFSFISQNFVGLKEINVTFGNGSIEDLNYKNILLEFLDFIYSIDIHDVTFRTNYEFYTQSLSSDITNTFTHITKNNQNASKHLYITSEHKLDRYYGVTNFNGMSGSNSMSESNSMSKSNGMLNCCARRVSSDIIEWKWDDIPKSDNITESNDIADWYNSYLYVMPEPKDYYTLKLKSYKDYCNRLQRAFRWDITCSLETLNDILFESLKLGGISDVETFTFNTVNYYCLDFFFDVISLLKGLKKVVLISRLNLEWPNDKPSNKLDHITLLEMEINPYSEKQLTLDMFPNLKTLRLVQWCGVWHPERNIYLLELPLPNLESLYLDTYNVLTIPITEFKSFRLVVETNTLIHLYDVSKSSLYPTKILQAELENMQEYNGTQLYIKIPNLQNLHLFVFDRFLCDYSDCSLMLTSSNYKTETFILL